MILLKPAKRRENHVDLYNRTEKQGGNCLALALDSKQFALNNKYVLLSHASTHLSIQNEAASLWETLQILSAIVASSQHALVCLHFADDSTLHLPTRATYGCRVEAWGGEGELDSFESKSWGDPCWWSTQTEPCVDVSNETVEMWREEWRTNIEMSGRAK